GRLRGCHGPGTPRHASALLHRPGAVRDLHAAPGPHRRRLRCPGGSLVSFPVWAQIEEEERREALFKQECVLEARTGFCFGLRELAQPGEPSIRSVMISASAWRRGIARSAKL